MFRRWVSIFLVDVHAPIVRKLWSVMALLAVYAAAVVVWDYLWGRDPDIKSNLHGLLGTVLGLFLVFRTNTAYDRWWEGRKLWGQLVNDLRNLAIKVRSLVRGDEE